MSKKRNRQPDANADPSEGSTESCDDSSTGAKCPHIGRAVNLSKLKKNIKKSGISIECIGCKKKEAASPTLTSQEEVKKSSIWICLQCGNRGCGRDNNGHAMEHFKKPFSDCHFLVADTHQWTVWCYQCESEIDAACRKKLLETVMFVKKLASAPAPLLRANSQNSRIPRPPLQNGAVDPQRDPNKLAPNLPKVGGLANLGNTCFFNAVLQCLAQTPFLVKVLDDLRLPGQKFVLPGGKHKTANSSEEVELPPIEGTLERWGSFTSILCKTLVDMQNTNGHQTYTPSELLNSFKKKTMHCMDGGQHDSHELLRHLLEIVRNEDLRRYQSIILKEVGLNEKTNPEGVENSIKSRVKYYGNQASARLLGPELIFRGVLVSTLECLDCHNTVHTTEPFLDLSLPVMADKPQPPHFKRKNPLYEDSFDVMGNSVSHVSWKNQKKPTRKNRKNKMQDAYAFSESTHDNSITGEVNTTTLEVDESDADVEDNVEVESLLPEVGESGYSSEKASALASPVSPSSTQASAKTNDVIPNGFPVARITDYQPADSNSVNTITSPSPTDFLTTCLSRTNLSAEPLGSSESPENDVPPQTGLSLPNSLALNSDLTSPEGPTASLSSVASPDKDSPSPRSPCSPPSPTSPLSGLNSASNACDPCNSCELYDPCKCIAHRVTDTADSIAHASLSRPHSRLDFITPVPAPQPLMLTLPPPDTALSSNNQCGNEAEQQDGIVDEVDDDSFERKLAKEEKEKEKEEDERSEEEKETRKVAIGECSSDKRDGRRKADDSFLERSIDSCNGMNGTISRSPVGSHAHRSPTRYATKEGECSIQSCLNQFTALELISGSNKVGCEACTARERKIKPDCKMVCTPSTKQYLISRVPAVLILHLKRFQAQRLDFRKVTKHVSFPMVLDLAPVCKGHKKSRIYALYGIVEHSGTIHGGHYVAYVKARPPLTPDDPRWAFLPSRDAKDTEESSSCSTSSSASGSGSCSGSDSEVDEATASPATTVEPPPGKWYHVSDSRVSEVDERTVLQSQAYLLFYERIL